MNLQSATIAPARAVWDKGGNLIGVLGENDTVFELMGRIEQQMNGPQAEMVAPQFRQAWAPPPAYAASTYVARGEARVSGGKIYTAVVPGITGAASAPAGTGSAAIVDGAVQWYYTGETFTADPAAPTVVVQAAVPAMTRFYRNAACGFVVPGAASVSNDNWFRRFGALFSLGDEGMAGTFDAVGHGGIEFFVDTASFAIVHKTWINYGIQIAVDGRFIQPTTYRSTVDGQNTYHVVTLKERKPETRVTVYWDTEVGGSPLRGVLVPSYGSVWADEADCKVMLVGDSFGVPKGVYDFGGHMQFAACIGAALGTVDAFGQCKGGSGFVTENVAGERYIARIQHVESYKPDVLIVEGSVNETAVEAAVLTAAVRDYIREVKRLSSETRIYVTGVTGSASPAAIAADAAYKAGVEAAGVAECWFIPAASDERSPWFTSLTGYIGADTVHPIQAGLGFLARRIAQGVRKVLRVRRV